MVFIIRAAIPKNLRRCPKKANVAMAPYASAPAVVTGSAAAAKSLTPHHSSSVDAAATAGGFAARVL